ncbi:MAG: DNA repair protein RecN, partial [Bacteroidales bacterium]|nr:DNA repair protein RecN [Bacteroidales bacterium]
ILMGAVSLLFGAKADPGVLRDKGKNCVVEAIFSLQDNQDQDIILRRVISPTGKSRSFLNDEPATVNELKELSLNLIDIHTQHQQLLLADSGFQLSVLDAYAGNETLLSSYKTVYDKVSSLRRLCSEMESKAAKERNEQEFNLFQYERLKEASLKEGETQELEEELKLLSNAEEIRNSLLSTAELISPSTEDISVVQRLKEGTSLLVRIVNNYSPAEELSARLESCRVELTDIEDDLRRKAERITISPERLAAVEERISLIYKLINLHNVKDESELIGVRESLKNRLDRTNNLTLEVEKIRSELAESEKQMESLAWELNRSRISSRDKFVSEITSAIRNLEMPYAEFAAEIKTKEDYNSFGKDSVTFCFSANKNMELRQLAKIASGGEISRIMLCLKAILASRKGMPAMILDEIDSGVSGSIADKMGGLIADLSKKMQIFAITHLPQIASKGDTHLLVFKEMDKTGAVKTKIIEITGRERVLELARMLSGSETGAAAIANAEELLGKN